LAKCADCGEFHLRHRVCLNCGKYRGKVIIDIEKEIAKREEKAKRKKKELEQAGIKENKSEKDEVKEEKSKKAPKLQAGELSKK